MAYENYDMFDIHSHIIYGVDDGARTLDEALELVSKAVAQGVTAIAQPGGAMRDAEVIMACNEASPQVAMVFTAQRSFKH